MSRDRSPHVCLWCSLPGHHQSTCHVRAEDRRETDDADRRACEIVHAAVTPGGRIDGKLVRALVAAELRLLLGKLADRDAALEPRDPGLVPFGED